MTEEELFEAAVKQIMETNKNYSEEEIREALKSLMSKGMLNSECVPTTEGRSTLFSIKNSINSCNN